MRLIVRITYSNSNQLIEFSNWLLNVGDGTFENSTAKEAKNEIIEEILIKSSDTALDDLMNVAYPNV